MSKQTFNSFNPSSRHTLKSSRSGSKNKAGKIKMKILLVSIKYSKSVSRCQPVYWRIFRYWKSVKCVSLKWRVVMSRFLCMVAIANTAEKLVRHPGMSMMGKPHCMVRLKVLYQTKSKAFLGVKAGRCTVVAEKISMWECSVVVGPLSWSLPIQKRPSAVTSM